MRHNDGVWRAKFIFRWTLIALAVIIGFSIWESTPDAIYKQEVTYFDGTTEIIEGPTEWYLNDDGCLESIQSTVSKACGVRKVETLSITFIEK